MPDLARSMRIRVLGAALVLLVVVVSISATAVLTVAAARAALTEQTEEALEAIAKTQEHRVERLAEQYLERLRLVTSRTQLRISLAEFAENGTASEAERAERILVDAAGAFPGVHNLSAILPNGSVAASTDPNLDGRTVTWPAAAAGLERDGIGPFFLDEVHGPSLHVAGPLVLDGQTIGSLVMSLGIGDLISITSDYTGLGETGETILAMADEAGDAVLIAPVRFDADAALRRTIPGGSADAGDLRVPTALVLAGETGVLPASVDYRGEPVLAAGGQVNGTGWAVVAKMDTEEALGPVDELIDDVWVFAVAAAAAATAIGVLAANAVARPIEALAVRARRMTKVGGARHVEPSGPTETRAMADALNVMVDRVTLTEGLKTQFINTAAHELYTPVTTLQVSSHTLAAQAKAKGDDQLASIAGKIERQVDRLGVVARELIEASRHEEEAEVKRVPAALEELVEEVMDDVKEQAAAAEVRLRVETMAGVRAECEPLRLQHALLNVLDNAIEMSPPGASVLLRVHLEDGRACIDVHDDGPGIDPDEAEHLFEPFYQGAAQRFRTRSGLGMGLYSTKRLVESQGGRVSVSPDPDGQGARFRLCVPALGPAKAP